jgi:hypothetical protein
MEHERHRPRATGGVNGPIALADLAIRRSRLVARAGCRDNSRLPMGGSGKALPGGGKRHKNNSPAAQSKDGGYGLPPHPRAVRPGQRYFPRAGRRRRLLQVVGLDAVRGIVSAKRVDDGHAVQLTSARMLAVSEDGQGLHYQFAGYGQRRYVTYAQVVEVDTRSSLVTLVLPEWHPGKPVRVATRLVPGQQRLRGAWLSCTADLSQPTAAALNVADLEPVGAPADHVPAVTWRPQRVVTMRPRPAAGRGCGDIVLELPAEVEAGALRRGLLDAYVAERPAGLRAGDRVYLSERGTIAAWLDISAVESRPMGAVLRCRPQRNRLAHPLPAGSRCEAAHWTWRWWTRAAEEEGGERLLAEAAAFDLEEHAPDYCWSRRVSSTPQDGAAAPARRPMP